MLENLDFEKIDTSALLALVGVSETRFLDFKRELPGRTDSEKKEFAADISSFANAAGGILVYGVTEESGTAKEICGVAASSSDDEVLRLQSMASTGVTPRIPGVAIRPVPGFRLGPVVLVRVPRSWAAPHLVVAGGAESRFFARTGTRKEPLDVQQIRAAFALSQDLPDRIRRFRDERLGRIVGDETPVPLRARARTVVHVIPVCAMAPGCNPVDLAELTAGDQRSLLSPIGTKNLSARFNIDGFLGYSHDRDGGITGYVQVFRSGAIEAVDTPGVERDGEFTIGSSAFPKTLMESLARYVNAVKGFKLVAPIVILVSMVGMKGVTLFVGPQSAYADEVVPIDREVLLLPEVLIEDFAEAKPPSNFDDQDIETKLKPVFDALWQACGLPKFFSP